MPAQGASGHAGRESEALTSTAPSRSSGIAPPFSCPKNGDGFVQYDYHGSDACVIECLRKIQCCGYCGYASVNGRESPEATVQVRPLGGWLWAPQSRTVGRQIQSLTAWAGKSWPQPE